MLLGVKLADVGGHWLVLGLQLQQCLLLLLRHRLVLPAGVQETVRHPRLKLGLVVLYGRLLPLAEAGQERAFSNNVLLDHLSSV